jgi:LmbE family N-acetylglucosaminyl deacetylase
MTEREQPTPAKTTNSSSIEHEPAAPSAPETASSPSAAVDAEAAVAAAEAAESPIPSGPKRIAVIFPHPDDAEFMCAGAIARWAAEGHEVVYVLLTSGDKGSDDPDLTTEQLVAIREAEQRSACDILGVKEVYFLRHLDATLVADLALRRELTRLIRQLKPDVVVCGDPSVRWSGQEYINHPDHVAAAEATLAAIFPSARDRRTFPELLAEGLEPHKVTEVYLAGAHEPDVWIDITDYIDLKLRALRAHVSQLNDWEPEEMIRQWAKEEAQRHEGSGEYAESFKYFKLD